MFDNLSEGKYWDESWNPILDPDNGRWGCAKVSEGCANCWAESMNVRFGGAPYDGRKRNFILSEKQMQKPIKAHKRGDFKVYFVCITMDLFHRDVPWGFIDDMMTVMDDCPQHIFLLLTKRPDVMAAYFSDKAAPDNVWPGTTIENQDWVDNRIPYLLQIQAKMRWLSLEPLLGPVDLQHCLPKTIYCYDDPYIKETCRADEPWNCAGSYTEIDTSDPYINWVTLGGETGHHARPMHLDWPRSVRDKCQAAGIPFYLKKIGHKQGRLLDGREHNEVPA